MGWESSWWSLSGRISDREWILGKEWKLQKQGIMMIFFLEGDVHFVFLCFSSRVHSDRTRRSLFSWETKTKSKAWVWDWRGKRGNIKNEGVRGKRLQRRKVVHESVDVYESTKTRIATYNGIFCFLASPFFSLSIFHLPLRDPRYITRILCNMRNMRVVLPS